MVIVKRSWTKRTSLNDNTRAILLYFIQTFPPCVSVQPIAAAGQDSGHDQAWQTTPFLIYRGKKNVQALVLLIRDVLFDVVAFIGLEMFISHSTTNLWSENTHLVTHFPENQVGKKKQNMIKTRAERTIFGQKKTLHLFSRDFTRLNKGNMTLIRLIINIMPIMIISICSVCLI